MTASAPGAPRKPFTVIQTPTENYHGAIGRGARSAEAETWS
jgi:hypothetical protein